MLLGRVRIGGGRGVVVEVVVGEEVGVSDDIVEGGCWPTGMYLIG